MDDNRGFVFRQLELHLLQHSEQQIEETYCRLFRAKTASIHFVADRTCQPAQYVLSSCQGVEQGFHVESGRATQGLKGLD